MNLLTKLYRCKESFSFLPFLRTINSSWISSCALFCRLSCPFSRNNGWSCWCILDRTSRTPCVSALLFLYPMHMYTDILEVRKNSFHLERLAVVFAQDKDRTAWRVECVYLSVQPPWNERESFLLKRNTRIETVAKYRMPWDASFYFYISGTESFWYVSSLFFPFGFRPSPSLSLFISLSHFFLVSFSLFVGRSDPCRFCQKVYFSRLFFILCYNSKLWTATMDRFTTALADNNDEPL